MDNTIEIDFCVKCGSENLKKVDKEVEFKINPKIVKIRQRCTECQECGEEYFNEKEMDEMSDKLKAEA